MTTKLSLLIDPFAGSGAAAIQLVESAAIDGGPMTLAGIALIITAVGKLVKNVCAGIAMLRPPK